MDRILATQGLQEPQWYKDNIPFVDTPDTNINGVYYYRWSTHKRALRYTTAGAGYIATEYDNPITYSFNGSYSGLVDAAGYHILDGRWLRNRTYMDDYINYWVRGAGVSPSRQFSEWVTGAAYQRYLVTGDATPLKANLTQFISHYNAWSSNFTANISVNGTSTTDSLYFQTPLADATEFTETSFRSTDAFGGGAGFRPTINSYQYANALAISKIAALAGDTANATTFAAKAAALKAAVQHDLWDPQRQFFMHLYNNDPTNVGIAGTRTTWREAMGFTPWAFELPDATYSTAWQYLTDARRFAGPDGPYTLERVHDFEAEQAAIVDASINTGGIGLERTVRGPDRQCRQLRDIHGVRSRRRHLLRRRFLRQRHRCHRDPGAGRQRRHRGSPITVTYPATNGVGNLRQHAGGHRPRADAGGREHVEVRTRDRQRQPRPDQRESLLRLSGIPRHAESRRFQLLSLGRRELAVRHQHDPHGSGEPAAGLPRPDLRHQADLRHPSQPVRHPATQERRAVHRRGGQRRHR